MKCSYLDCLSKPYDFQGDDDPLHSNCILTGKHCNNYFGMDCELLEERVNENTKKENRFNKQLSEEPIEIAPTYPSEDFEGDLNKLPKSSGKCRIYTLSGCLRYFSEIFDSFKKNIDLEIK